MTNTTKAPHCPRCGGEMVRPSRRTRYGVPLWFARCDGCGFGAEEDLDDTDALAEARRLIRAELARQEADYYRESRFKMEACRSDIMIRYAWLGTHPLRLPGEHQ